MVKVFSWNANSLPLKELEFLTFLRQFDSVICAVSEARMNYLATEDKDFVDISRAGFHVLGYPKFRQGILLYISPHLKVRPLLSYCICKTDVCSIALEVKSPLLVPGESFTVLFGYTHDGNVITGLNRLLEVYDELRQDTDAPVYLMGDFNAKFSNSGRQGVSNAAGRFLKNYLEESQLVSYQHHVPTHGTAHIDYFIGPPGLENISILDDLSSDHKLVSAEIPLLEAPEKEYFTSWAVFERKLKLCPQWDHMAPIDHNVDQMMQFFQDILHQSRRPLPQKHARNKTGNSFVVFTPELRRIKTQRNRCKRGTPEWKNLNAEFRKALRQARAQSWHETQTQLVENSRGAGCWRMLRRLRGANGPSGRIYDPEAVARDFEKFHKISPELEKQSMDVPDEEIEEYVSRPSVVEGVTGIEIKAILKSLPKQSGVGYDKIPYRVFKPDSDPRLIQWLVDCCNSILQSGDWPVAWKLAEVKPLPKASGGFRPISLLVCLSKIVERVVYRRLKRESSAMNLLQSQFASHGGCEYAVSQFLDHVSSSLPQYSFVVFFDVKKAFDRVVRKRLLKRMKDLGFSPYLVSLVSSFLSDRRCKIKANYYFPDHGVPQGSVLGPILFQILVDHLLADLPVNYKASYADDMVISVTVNRTGIGIERLRQALKLIETRAGILGIDFDEVKTKLMVICDKRSRRNFDFQICFKGKILEYVSEYKYLGIWIDRRLTFGKCVQVKCSESSRRISMINRLAYGSRYRRTLYLGFVQSYLFYCIRPIWKFLADCWRTKLSKIVEKGARMICSLTKWAFNASSFAKIHTPEVYCSGVLPRISAPRYFSFSRSDEVQFLRCLHGSAWCNQRKFRMHLLPSSKCRFCVEPVESMDHLLFDCPGLDGPERQKLILAVRGHRRFDELPKTWSPKRYSTISSRLQEFSNKWELYF